MHAVSAQFSPGASGLLAPLRNFLVDESVSEILINRPKEVFVEKGGCMLHFEIEALTTQYLRRLFTLIANECGQVLSQESPMLSGNLFDGSRVQLVIPPAAEFETLSIRKFLVKQVSFAEYGKHDFFKKTMPFDLNEPNKGCKTDDEALLSLYQKRQWQDFLIKAIELKKNIIISGATSSGKTTFLNSCIGLIPKHERLITLEDSYEIQVAHQNIVRLKAIKKTQAQKTGLSMQDLLQASLRLRPDRLIMGEIRGAEVFDFISACSTGHNGTLATLHANNPRIAFMRMAQLYKLNQVAGMSDADIYKELHEVIDLIVQLEKTDHGRRMTAVYYKELSMNQQPLTMRKTHGDIGTFFD